MILISLHTEALCWLRFGKRMPIVATEVGPWRADVLGVSSRSMIEVEIKKSRSDLQAEFRNKKAKHFLYASGEGRFVPNFFYFYVPAALGDYAEEFLAENCPKAGLAIHLDTTALDGRNTAVIKKPTRLNDKVPSKDVIRTAIMRMSSELCGRYVIQERQIADINSSLQQMVAAAVTAAHRAAGSLDPEATDEDLLQRAAELAFAVEGIVAWASDEQRDKWIAAAKRWLEAQYLNSKEWDYASYHFRG